MTSNFNEIYWEKLPSPAAADLSLLVKIENYKFMNPKKTLVGFDHLPDYYLLVVHKHMRNIKNKKQISIAFRKM